MMFPQNIFAQRMGMGGMQPRGGPVMAPGAGVQPVQAPMQPPMQRLGPPVQAPPSPAPPNGMPTNRFAGMPGMSTGQPVMAGQLPIQPQPVPQPVQPALAPAPMMPAQNFMRQRMMQAY